MFQRADRVPRTTIVMCHEKPLDVLIQNRYGIQPLSILDDSMMLPKARYKALREVIGDPWLAFTGTAADQVHVRGIYFTSHKFDQFFPRHSCTSTSESTPSLASDSVGSSQGIAFVSNNDETRQGWRARKKTDGSKRAWIDAHQSARLGQV